MTIEQRVRQFIVENFYVPEAAVLGADASLIDGGFVDSTGMLELIAFLEAEYGLRIADTETTPENLGTIGRIAAFVGSKRSALTG